MYRLRMSWSGRMETSMSRMPKVEQSSMNLSGRDKGEIGEGNEAGDNEGGAEQHAPAGEEAEQRALLGVLHDPRAQVRHLGAEMQGRCTGDTGEMYSGDTAQVRHLGAGEM